MNLNPFNRSNRDTVDDELETMPQIPLSEGMLKRDNFFHSCWMLLKKQRPDLWDDMSKVEIILSGYDPDEKEEIEDEKKEDEGTVM